MIIDDKAITDGLVGLNIIEQIRKDKSDNNFSIKQEISKLNLTAASIENWHQDFILDLKAVNNIKEINISDSDNDDIKLNIEYKTAG